MSKGWKEITLSELEDRGCLFKDGDWIESKDQNPNGDIRLIQLSDIGELEFRDRSAKFLTQDRANLLKCTYLQKGDILIARMPDPLGRACLFPLDGFNKYVTAVDVSIFRSSYPELDSKYLCYCINSPQIRSEISALQAGSTRKRISRKNLGTIKLPIAPYKDQKRIVSKIENLFAQINLGLTELSSTQGMLELYKQSILNAAIRGKLVLQDPNDESASVLLEKIKAVKEALIKAGELKKEKSLSSINLTEIPFELPRNWQWVRLAEVIALFQNGISKRNGNVGKETVVLRLADIEGNNFILDSLRKIKLTEEEVKKYAISADDIICIRVNGSRNLVAKLINTDNVVGSCYSDHLIRIRPNPLLLDKNYLILIFQSLIIRNQIESFMISTAGQHTISQSSLQNILLPLPPLVEQKRIMTKLHMLTTSAQILANETNKIYNMNLMLKQSILKRAFEGKLI